MADKPGELECALRALAFNYSQILLPRRPREAQRAAQQAADVAAALRLQSDCGIDVPLSASAGSTNATSSGGSRPTRASGSCSLYVAKAGSDASGTGSKVRPFATLGRAQLALSSARSSIAEHCTVYVGAGIYYLPSTLVLGPDDSNSAWLAEDGADVTLSGGAKIPTSTFKPSSLLGSSSLGGASPAVLAADVSTMNLSTITPYGSTRGPVNRLFVDDVPMTWARYPDVPPHLPECALKIPIGRIGLSTPPRVGFMPSEGTAEGSSLSRDESWAKSCGVVANHSWMIPTIGDRPGAYYTKEEERVTNFPNWSSPGWNGGGTSGGARPGWEGTRPVMDRSGMSPCYVDAVGGPFQRFTPPVGHGPFRTRTVTVAPVGHFTLFHSFAHTKLISPRGAGRCESCGRCRVLPTNCRLERCGVGSCAVDALVAQRQVRRADQRKRRNRNSGLHLCRLRDVAGAIWQRVVCRSWPWRWLLGLMGLENQGCRPEPEADCVCRGRSPDDAWRPQRGSLARILIICLLCPELV